MATFEGSNKDFKRWIGPRLRNLVNLITKKHRVAVGACEHCGSKEELESAHVHGRDRTEIIDLILGNEVQDNLVIRLDLDRFEQEFRSAHEPFENVFLILCRNCHRKYDFYAASSVPQAGGASRPDAPHNDVLPISFDPHGAVACKQALLIEKVAEISVVYADGRTEVRHWDASRFSDDSNLIGNIRSRPDLRQGIWQSRGIVKVHVRVKTNA